MGTFRYTVLAQGVCSNGDLFNFLMEGGCKLDADFKVLKNIDDFLIYANTLEELEEQIMKLVKLCRNINLKLSPAKFRLNTAVKFSGSIISSEKMKENICVFLDP